MKKLMTNPTSLAIFISVLMVGLVLLPKHILEGNYIYLGVTFMVLFALNMTCLIEAIHQRAKTARAMGAGLLEVIATALGFVALSACGVGGPLCGALFGSLVVSSVLPAGSLGYFTHYAPYVVTGAIVIQIISLWFLGCFKRN